jgi:hypothetical protein
LGRALTPPALHNIRSVFAYHRGYIPQMSDFSLAYIG